MNISRFKPESKLLQILVAVSSIILVGVVGATASTIITGGTQPDGYELNVTTLSPQGVQPTEVDLRANVTAKDEIYDGALVYWNVTNTETSNTDTTKAEIALQENQVSKTVGGLKSNISYETKAYVQPIIIEDKKLLDNAINKAGKLTFYEALGQSQELQNSYIQSIKTGEEKAQRIGIPNLKSPSVTGNSINTQDSGPSGLVFNSDGTKLYEIGSDGGKFYSYVLSRPFDLTSATFTGNSINTQDSNPEGLAFNSDGTKLYEIGSVGDKIYSYSLSTPFDLTSATFTGNSINTQDSNPEGLAFNNDGTKLYETGSVGEKIYSYSLSTPFDLTSATFTGNSINTQDSNPQGLAFNSDGTKMYEIGIIGEKIYSYSADSVLLERNTTLLKTIPGGSKSFSTAGFSAETVSLVNASYVGTSYLIFRGNISGFESSPSDPLQVNFSYRKEGETGFTEVRAEKIDGNTVVQERVDGLDPNSTYEFKVGVEAGVQSGTSKVNTTFLKTVPGGSKSFTTDPLTVEASPPPDTKEQFERLVFNGSVSGIDSPLSEPEDLKLEFREKGNTGFRSTTTTFTSNRSFQVPVSGLKQNTTYEYRFSAAGTSSTLREATTSCVVNRTVQIPDGGNITSSGCSSITVGNNGSVQGSGSAEVRVDEALSVSSGGSISAQKINVTASRIQNSNSVTSINATGLGAGGGNGSVRICDTVPSVECPVDDSGVELKTSLNKTGDGLYKIRNVSEDWSPGFLNFTENISLTNKFDGDFSGAIQSNYTVTGLTENLEFKALKDGTVVETENSGSNGKINFSATLTDKHRFEVLESVEPTFSNLQQEADIVNPERNTSLSLDVSDIGSGVSKVRLTTNESGVFENRSEYIRELDNIGSGSIQVNWSNPSFDGEVNVIGYRFFVEDAAGNVNATEVRTFTVDGRDPSLSNLQFPQILDVDSSPAQVSVDAEDSPASLDLGILRENSTGSPANTTVQLDGSAPQFSTSVERIDPSVVDFTAFVNDTVGNTESVSGSISFRNVSIELTAEDLVNSSKQIDVSGSASVLPSDTPITGSLTASVDTGSDFSQAGSVSTNSLGNYNSQVGAPAVAGTHLLRLESTTANGVSGFSTERFNVSLNVSQADAVFGYTGDRFADVDRETRTVNLTARVSNSTDSEVASVQANISQPNGSFQVFDLDNTTSPQHSGTWFREVDTTQFGEQTGRFNATFTAETARGIGSNIAEASFSVRNVSLDVQVPDRNVTAGKNFSASGTALLEPDRRDLDGEILVEKPSEEVSVPVSSGSFDTDLSVSEPGTHTLNFSYNSTNRVIGRKSVEVNVFELQTRITETRVGGDISDSVFKDSSSDVDLNFSDVVVADSDNPASVDDLDLSYNFPSGFNIRENNPFIGSLAPGASASNGPKVDIGKQVEPGNFTVNISTSSNRDIEVSNSTTVRVFARSQSDYLNIQDGAAVSRERSKLTVRSNVTDTVSGAPLEDINTTLVVRDSAGNANLTLFNTSNSSGGVEFNVNLSDLQEEAGKILTMRTLDQPGLNVNSSEESELSNRIEFDLQAKMSLDSQSDVSPVQRNGDNITTLGGSLVDSTGASISDAAVTAEFPGKIRTTQTDADGRYSFTYDPDDALEPGVKTVNLTATKQDFTDFEFDDTVEVRGNLSISGDVSQDFLQRGTTETLTSSVSNSFGEQTTGDVTWTLNQTSLGQGAAIDIFIPTSLDRGFYYVNASTNRQFYNDAEFSKQVFVTGLASVRMEPGDFVINPGSNVEFNATVTNQTGGVIENYPVSLELNSSDVGTVDTDASGIASFNQQIGQGVDVYNASIQSSRQLLFNVTKASDTSVATGDKRLVLNQYSLSENDIFRYLRTPFRTVISIELLRTTDSVDLTPAAGRTVTVTVNGSENISCSTADDGTCKNTMLYNPGDNVSVGNLTAKAVTSTSEFTDVNRTRRLVVRGDLDLSVQSPKNNSNIARENEINLQADVSSDAGPVSIKPNWTLGDEKIANGTDEVYEVPLGESTGEKSLSASVDAPFFRGDTENRTVFVLGSAKPVLRSPDNETEKGYGNSFQMECSVVSNGARINEYPVEFVSNASGTFETFATDKVSGGPAVATWEPVDRSGAVSAGCRIQDNRTLGFSATQNLDTKAFTLFDNKPPQVSNLEVSPSEVDPGSTADITFNATDENSIKSIDVTVLDPSLNSDSLEATSTSGTGFEAVFPGSESEGGYSVEVTVTDSNDNFARDRQTFSVNPGGSIEANPSNVEVDSVRATDGDSFTTTAKVFVNETANLLNISASSETLEFNTTEYNCGDTSQGSYCNRTFEVAVPADTSPTGASPLFAEFTGQWNSPSEQGDSTTSAFTQVSVLPNPVVETSLKSPQPAESQHTSRTNVSLSLDSVGNTEVKSIDPEFRTDSPIVSRLFGFPSSLASGGSADTQVELGVPNGTPPSTYTGTLEVDSSNAPRETGKLELEIPEDTGYRAPEKVTAGAVSRSDGVLTSIELKSTGNKDISFDPTFADGPNNVGCGTRLSAEDFTLEKQTNTSVKILYDFDGFGFVGTCQPEVNLETQGTVSNTKTVSLDTDVVSFKLNESVPKITARPGDKASFNFTASLGGQNITENLAIEARLGEQPITQIETETEAGTILAEYTVPQVEDAESHNLVFNVTSESADVTSTSVVQNAVSVPDLTPPEFGSFTVEDVEPGQPLAVEVSVSDNSDSGLNKVLIELDGSTSRTVELNRQVENFTAEISDLDPGPYTAQFTAVDAAGLKSVVEKRFRVAERISVEDSFTTATGNPVETSITLRDVATEDKIRKTTDENGSYRLSLNKGRYDVSADVQSSEIEVENTSVSENLSLRGDELGSAQTADLAPNTARSRVMGLAVKTNLNSSSNTVTFDYSDRQLPPGTDPSDLKVAYCPKISYSELTCNASLQTLNLSVLNINRARQTITLDVPGFSSYTLFAPQTESSEEQDNQNQPDNTDTDGESGGSSGGGGGNSGGGGLSDGTEQQIDEIQSELDQENDAQQPRLEFGTRSIEASLVVGSNQTTSLAVRNGRQTPQTFQIQPSESVAEYIQAPEEVAIDAESSQDVVLNISAPSATPPDTYSGFVEFESDLDTERVPVAISVRRPNQKLLDLSLTPVFDSFQPGDTLRVETSFSNQGYARSVDVTSQVRLVDPGENRTVVTKQNTYAVGTTLTRVVKLQLPETVETGSYELRGSVNYTNIDADLTASAIAPVQVVKPFWQRTVFGLKYSSMGIFGLLTLLVSIGGYAGYQYYRRRELEKKRYMENIDLDTIPTGGGRQGFIGEIAEMGKRTFIGIDDLKTHALIAGATGSGKTVAGQVMVEEALEKGTNVIVLDPTAQWTGYLRENEDPEMLKLLQEFGMSKSDAKSYDGNIRAVEPDEEEIDITPYLKEDEEGNIIIFSLHKLDSKNIEDFVDTTIQQVFDANLPERDNLQTLICYDEVHRLLKEFGGTGKGLKQLERGAREFRKYGVGMMLISQVISDFSGEIRANIGTTVQMRTQYDSDLERMKNKFGMDTAKSIAKAEQGSGMLQNSDYNHGRPYFVNFRPLKHSPHRLSDEELEDYEEYNRRIDRMEEKVSSLEEEGKDVYEYRNKIKLARRNLRKGGFSLIDIYLDELEGDLNK